MKKALGVGELNRYIKKTLAMDYFLGKVNVRGELSGTKLHSNGNLYFILKDREGKVRGTIFNAEDKLEDFHPVDGMEVEVKGTVSIYEREGLLQLFGERMVPVGDGEWYLRFLQLKERLEKEGLFEEKRKKPLPRFPRKIGIITSRDGAALKDMVSVGRRRNPKVDFYLFPASVQGGEAVPELMDALERAERQGNLDILIIGRGGGAYEDLQAFNDETLVRRIAGCPLPIISAVGHEVDITLSDFAADVRAATPSAAGELAVPLLEEWESQRASAGYRLEREFRRRRDQEDLRVDQWKKRLDNYSPRRQVAVAFEETRELLSRLERFSPKTKIAGAQERLTFLLRFLQRNTPIKTVNRVGEQLEGEYDRLRRAFRQRQDREPSLLSGEKLEMKGKIHGRVRKENLRLSSYARILDKMGEKFSSPAIYVKGKGSVYPEDMVPGDELELYGKGVKITAQVTERKIYGKHDL